MPILILTPPIKRQSKRNEIRKTMIERAILNSNDELSPAILKWDYEKEDFVIDVPKGITIEDLVRLTEEIKRLVEWECKL